mgnify:CR=1 FL=1|jgi:hypothetical protein
MMTRMMNRDPGPGKKMKPGPLICLSQPTAVVASALINMRALARARVKTVAITPETNASITIGIEAAARRSGQVMPCRERRWL